MNIVIFGGGTPNRLGNLLGLKAQAQGHQVVSVSHCDNGASQVPVVATDFDNIDSVNSCFCSIIDQWQTIDLVLYCIRNPNNTKITTESFDSQHSLTNESYKSLTLDVLLPHRLMLTAHSRKLQSHFVFFTTGLALSLQPETQGAYATYIGGKAWQLHLMKAVSAINTTIQASAFSVHFDWDAESDHQGKLNYLYDLILNHRRNGSIISVYDAQQARLIELDIMKHVPLLDTASVDILMKE